MCSSNLIDNISHTEKHVLIIQKKLLHSFVFQVYFDKNYTLDDVNKRDFFYEVFHEMLSPESGMFMFNDSETLAWFTSNVRTRSSNTHF